MRRRIARQDPDVHSDAFTGETQEPLHRRAGEMRATWRGIDPRTHSPAHDPARRVHEIAVKTGMVVRVFFHDGKMPVRRFVSAFAR